MRSAITYTSVFFVCAGILAALLLPAVGVL